MFICPACLKLYGDLYRDPGDEVVELSNAWGNHEDMKAYSESIIICIANNALVENPKEHHMYKPTLILYV